MDGELKGENIEMSIEKKPEIREGKRYFEIIFCAGCQTCWNIDDNGELERSEHVIYSEDVTEAIVKLKEKEKESEQSKDSKTLDS